MSDTESGSMCLSGDDSTDGDEMCLSSDDENQVKKAKNANNSHHSSVRKTFSNA